MVTLIIVVLAFLLGALVGHALAGGRQDLLVDALADGAGDRFRDLPEPTDEEVRRMIAAARLTPSDATPFAFPVMVLGTALLAARQRAESAPSSTAPEVGQSPGQTPDTLAQNRP